MSEQLSWGLLGAGKIGTEFYAQVSSKPELGLEAEPEFVFRQHETPFGEVEVLNNTFEVAGYLEDDGPNVLIVALPSTGEPANELIQLALSQGTRVITAEKGALAENFAAIRDGSKNFKYMGINASVSGGIGLLELSQTYLSYPRDITQIHMAPNGTLTAWLSWTAHGDSPGQAIEQAVTNGYAEPVKGSPDAFTVVREEAEADVPKKVSIFMNYTGLAGDEVLDWRALTPAKPLTEDDFNRIVEEAKVRRYVVSIYPLNGSDRKAHGPESDIIGGFDIVHGDWRIVGGFRNVEKNPLMGPLASLTGPGNGMVIGLGPNERYGDYAITGPGAGPGPTVRAMTHDLARLKETF